jgi:hypothetical protein
VRRWQVAAGLVFGQVKKSYRRRKLVRVTHVMGLGAQANPKVARPWMGFSGRLNTACIERVNLTVRYGVAVLARLTWATAKPAHNSRPIWNGGELTLILFVSIHRYE